MCGCTTGLEGVIGAGGQGKRWPHPRRACTEYEEALEIKALSRDLRPLRKAHRSRLVGRTLPA